MKKLIAFAMSAVLAVSAVALPVSAEVLAGSRRQSAEAAVSVTTDQRKPCSLTPAAPIVDHRTQYEILLVEREGYEYRMNNGPWQDYYGFYNLEADTEYVFYQRIKETDEEYASEPTQLRAQTLATPHNTSYENHEKLMKYISANGKEDELGNSSISYSWKIDSNNTYYFVISNWGTSVMCKVFNASKDASYLSFRTTFMINKYGKDMYPSSTVLFIYEGQCIEEISLSAPATPTAEYTDFCFNTISGSSDYLPDETLNDLFNSTIAMLASFWDEMIYQELGFGLKGLGFLSYDGYGALYCTNHAGYHVGTPVNIDYRDPGCVIYGSEGNDICSACGEIMKYGDVIAPKGGHRYDNDLDPECNVCGEQRRIHQHLYSFDCDADCDTCGKIRTEGLVPHSYTNGVCICGHESKLPGDASGDGKLNMGDVAKVYAHIRGTVQLTNDNALTAADVSGDGKINLGDVSRILAHITGKKPLW